MKSPEKNYIPSSNPEWDQELPDGMSNSLVNKDGRNWDNGYNFDEKDEENNVVGVVVYQDSNCTSWDTGAVRKKFEATGLELPENFDRANEGYMKKTQMQNYQKVQLKSSLLGFEKNIGQMELAAD